ncbi:MAG: hypothetical protein ACTSO7_15800 [Candidatus Heimdallarchaeota archaeon]
MAKIRLEAIALLGIAILGFVLYASTNIAVQQYSFNFDDDNWGESSAEYTPWGGAKIIYEGEEYGVPFSGDSTLTSKDFDDYNHGLWVFALLGLLLALGSGVLYLLDIDKIPKFVALILGVLGGAMMATSGFFVFAWFDFSNPSSGIPFGEISIRVGAAFHLGLIFGLLVIAAAVFLFIYKPKKEAAVA